MDGFGVGLQINAVIIETMGKEANRQLKYGSILREQCNNIGR